MERGLGLDQARGKGEPWPEPGSEVGTVEPVAALVPERSQVKMGTGLKCQRPDDFSCVAEA